MKSLYVSVLAIYVNFLILSLIAITSCIHCGISVVSKYIRHFWIVCYQHIMLGMLEIRRDSSRLIFLPTDSVDQRQFDEHLSGLFLNRFVFCLRSKNSLCSLADCSAAPEEGLAKVASPVLANNLKSWKQLFLILFTKCKQKLMKNHESWPWNHEKPSLSPSLLWQRSKACPHSSVLSDAILYWDEAELSACSFTCLAPAVCCISLLKLQSDSSFQGNNSCVLVGYVPQQMDSFPCSYEAGPQLLKTLKTRSLQL